MEYIKALIKFSEKEIYQKDLIDGKLYFNNIEHIRSGGNDPFDAYTSRIKTDYGNIMLLTRPDSLKPVTCFYAVTDDSPTNNANIKIKKDEYDKLCNDLGRNVTIIKDVPKFINLVKENSFAIFYGCCDYSGVDIPITPIFNKRNNFSIEHEFRILLDDVILNSENEELVADYYNDFLVTNKHFILNMPSLENITETCDVSEVLAGKSIEVSFDKEKNKKDALSNVGTYLNRYE